MNMTSPTIDFEAMAKQVIGIDQKPEHKFNESKYIIVNYGGIPTAFPVPMHVQHIDVCIYYKGEICYPISAGFFSRSAAGIAAYGYSESLNLHSRPEDAAILDMI